MISLGQISLRHADAVFIGRAKARRVAVEFGLDDVAATRLSTAVSQVVRWVCKYDGAAVAEFGLDTTGKNDDLVFTVVSSVPVPEPTFLQHLVDSVALVDDTVTARLRLTGHLVDDIAVKRARAIIAEKSRDELLAEVRAQNEALEASKDVLEQTVRDRTSELAIALEQVENSETFIHRWDSEGTITAMNRYGLKFFGYEESKVLGKNAFETVGPESEAARQDWVHARERLFANPTNYTETELEHRKKDGTPVWLALRNRAILNSEGEIAEVLSIGIDVTERRELEASLQSANQRMEGELNIGRDIQMSMLPRQFPAFPDRDDFVVFATLEPAREVGGDLYDFFLIDDDHLCFLVGDVSDKGVPAALFMAVTKTAIKSQALSDSNAASILTHVNDELAENNESSMFVTLFVAILDTRTGHVAYSNAGHNPPYVKKADGSVLKIDDRHGPVAGAISGIAFGSSELVLEPGDSAILFTDGVTEAMDVDHLQYTDAALETLIQNAAFDTPEEVVSQINEAVAVHRGEAEPSDDITVLTMTYRGADPLAAYLKLEVTAELESIATVLERFETFAAEHGLDNTIRRQILLALDDLLTNVVSYAYSRPEQNDGEPQNIEIRVELTDARAMITISDRGVPFNPFGLNAPDIRASIEEREIGGLGIHLIREVMDEVEYSRRAGRNVVTVTKRFEPDNEASGETPEDAGRNN